MKTSTQLPGESASTNNDSNTLSTLEHIGNQIILDLKLDYPFIKGQDIKISNCWHFYSDGNAVDELFYNDEDFIAGMNRIYVTKTKHDVTILAFVLMDTHIHFILHGLYAECSSFVHDYFKRTSRYIAIKHLDNKKLAHTGISHQQIGTDRYLKSAICYTIKNPVNAGMPFLASNYPWSSGALYFAGTGYWSSSKWQDSVKSALPLSALKAASRRSAVQTRLSVPSDVHLIDGLVFPGDYVDYRAVERLFRSQRAFSWFMGATKDSDVESRGGSDSYMLLPMQEMRQHKTEVCREIFGVRTVKGLNTTQRMQLARTLKSRFNSSSKQILRLCGLPPDRMKDF